MAMGLGQVQGRVQAGFTLVQTIVTLFLVSILASLAKPASKAIAEVYKQRAGVSNVKNIMVSARQRAMANPSIHCGVYFQIDSLSGQARMFEDSGNPEAYSYDSTVDKRYGQPLVLPRGARFSIPPGLSNVVIFRGDGSSWNSNKIVVTTGNRKDTVSVLAATGRIKVSR